MPFLSSITSSNFSKEGSITYEQQFISPGTFYWIVPDGVTSISIVAVAGGGGGQKTANGGASGQGAQLTFINNVSVTPGETYEIVVGDGGEPSDNAAGQTGGNTYMTLISSNTTIIYAAGGAGGFNNF
jgi:hypothetical protein